MRRLFVLSLAAASALVLVSAGAACGTLKGDDDGTAAAPDAGGEAAPPEDAGDPDVRDANVPDGRAPCVETAPCLLAPDPGAFGIAADGTYVFWTTHLDGGGGAVRRYTKSTGAIDTLQGDLEAPRAIALTQDYVFWTLDGPGDALSGAIQRMQRDGGGGVTSLAGEARPRAIAADEVGVAWASSGAGATTGKIGAADLSLGAPGVVAYATEPSAVGLDPVFVYSGQNNATGSIVRHKRAVSFAQTAGGGGNAGQVRAMALSATDTFFTSQSGVGRVPNDGTFPQVGSLVYFDSAHHDAIGIATDTTLARVYYVTGGGELLVSDGVSRVSSALPDGVTTPGALYVAVDATTLYWTWQSTPDPRGPGGVYAIRKPP